MEDAGFLINEVTDPDEFRIWRTINSRERVRGCSTHAWYVLIVEFASCTPRRRISKDHFSSIDAGEGRL
jgi:hypothetical protein